MGLAWLGRSGTHVATLTTYVTPKSWNLKIASIPGYRKPKRKMWRDAFFCALRLPCASIHADTLWRQI